jgi:hypothetical protein
MVSRKENRVEPEPQRIRLTVRLTLPAFDVLTDIQRIYRKRTGRALPLWKILDVAVMNSKTSSTGRFMTTLYSNFIITCLLMFCAGPLMWADLTSPRLYHGEPILFTRSM